MPISALTLAVQACVKAIELAVLYVQGELSVSCASVVVNLRPKSPQATPPMASPRPRLAAPSKLSEPYGPRMSMR